MAPDRTILHLVEKKNPPLKNYGVHTIKPQLHPWLLHTHPLLFLYL